MKAKHYVLIAIAVAAIAAVIFRRQLMLWYEHKKLADQKIVESAVVQEKVNEAVIGLLGGPL